MNKACESDFEGDSDADDKFTQNTPSAGRPSTSNLVDLDSDDVLLILRFKEMIF